MQDQHEVIEENKDQEDFVKINVMPLKYGGE
jgi:hypothetical protein